jgi:hypothetical protein
VSEVCVVVIALAVEALCPGLLVFVNRRVALKHIFVQKTHLLIDCTGRQEERHLEILDGDQDRLGSLMGGGAFSLQEGKTVTGQPRGSSNSRFFGLKPAPR